LEIKHARDAPGFSSRRFGVTALMGCFLCWVLQVTLSAVAFSSFANLP
jgi:hypothetical protein